VFVLERRGAGLLQQVVEHVLVDNRHLLSRVPLVLHRQLRVQLTHLLENVVLPGLRLRNRTQQFQFGLGHVSQHLLLQNL